MTAKDLIKQTRLKRCMSQQDLAHKCGVSEATISRIETGSTYSPSFDLTVALLRCMGYELELKPVST